MGFEEEEMCVCSPCHLEPEAPIPQAQSSLPQPALGHFSGIYLSCQHWLTSFYLSLNVNVPSLSILSFSPIYSRRMIFTHSCGFNSHSKPVNPLYTTSSHLFWAPVLYSLLTIVIYTVFNFSIQCQKQYIIILLITN